MMEEADGEDGAQTKMPELSPDQGKAEHGLVGLVDGCAEFFSYNECENGLERFKPDIDAYVSRYKAKVGYWLRKASASSRAAREIRRGCFRQSPVKEEVSELSESVLDNQRKTKSLYMQNIHQYM